MMTTRTCSIAVTLFVATVSVAEAWMSVLPLSSISTVGTPAKTRTMLDMATVASAIVPPRSTAALKQEMGSTAQTYEDHVQKTYGRYPLTIAYGKGCRLYTTDGKDYLDCVSGIATCALGHSNPELTAAITQQMEECHHVSNLYLIPAQAALAEWLCQNSVADKVFFCNSGAEANEAAIKLARRHASNRGITKPIIITAEQSFHGRTLATITATGQPKYQKGFGYGGEMVPGFRYVPYNDVAALEAMVQEIQKDPEMGLAAIMMEALQGEGGIIPGNPEFFIKARELCDATGALLINDEVQVGMGRTGKLWGYENLPVTPDIFTSAKALGGGVPIGAMMAAGDAANVFGPGDHASTYGGNPLACAAGLAVAKYFCDHDVLENVRARSKQLWSGLEALATKYPNLLGGVRGWGLLMGVVSKDKPAGELVQAAMDEGLLLVAAGPNVVRWVPPLIITQAEIQEGLDKFEKALEKMNA